MQELKVQPRMNVIHPHRWMSNWMNVISTIGEWYLIGWMNWMNAWKKFKSNLNLKKKLQIFNFYTPPIDQDASI